MGFLDRFFDSDSKRDELKQRVDSLELRLDRLEKFIQDEYAPGWQMEQKVLQNLTRLMTSSEIADSINRSKGYTDHLLEQMTKKSLIEKAGRREDETLFRKTK